MRSRGFTLIELAIILVILGVLVGLGAGVVGLLIQRVHYNQTRERLEANVEAVVGRAELNRGCIPAVDDPSTPYGYCSSLLRNRTDAWRKDFLCLVADEIANYTASCSICARRTTSLTVVDEMDNATHPDIAVVLVSAGPNRNLQTAIQNTSTNTTVYIPLPGTPNFDNYTSSEDPLRPQSYDDLVRYVSLSELKGKLRCVYSEENLRILNHELPYGFVGSAYQARVYARGGVPYPSDGKYRWCVEDPDNATDAGLNFLCDTGNPLSGNCSSTPETDWPRCDQLLVNGTPSASGNFELTFWVRDNNDPSGGEDNIASRTLVLTINPATAGGGGGVCAYGSSITLVNRGGNRYLRVGNIWGGWCSTIFSSCIAFHSVTVTSNQCLRVYQNSSCRSLERILFYDNLYSADTSRDCVVSYVNGTLQD